MVYVGTNCENGVSTASNFSAVITSIRKGKIPSSLLKKLFNEYRPLDKVQVNSCSYIKVP